MASYNEPIQADHKSFSQIVSLEDSEEIPQVFKHKYLPSMLGSETFIKWVRKTFFSRKRDKERLQKDRNFRKRIKKMNDLLIKGQEET